MKDGIAIVFPKDGGGSAYAGTAEWLNRNTKTGEINFIAKKVTTHATVAIALLNAGVNNAYVNLMNTAADASLEADWYKKEYNKAKSREEMQVYDIAVLERKIEILQRQLQGTPTMKGQTP